MNDQEFNVDEAQVGRILHFVTREGNCRPALVVNDWPGAGRPGYVNLVVFPDGSNDRDRDYGIDKHVHKLEEDKRTDIANMPLLTRWETSVHPNHAVRAVGFWHWPRECKNLQDAAPPYIDKAGVKTFHTHAAGIVDARNCYACRHESNEVARNQP